MGRDLHAETTHYTIVPLHRRAVPGLDQISVLFVRLFVVLLDNRRSSLIEEAIASVGRRVQSLTGEIEVLVRSAVLVACYNWISPHSVYGVIRNARCKISAMVPIVCC